MVLGAQQFGQFDEERDRTVVVVRTPGRRFESRDRVRIEITQAVAPVNRSVKTEPQRDSKRCNNHNLPDLHTLQKRRESAIGLDRFRSGAGYLSRISKVSGDGGKPLVPALRTTARQRPLIGKRMPPAL